MTTYNDLKKAYNDRVSANMTDHGVFWAFGSAQFEENRPKDLPEGEKLVSIGAGGYMPKSMLIPWLAKHKELEKEYKKIMKQHKDLAEQAILYELNNYECFYSGDIANAMPTLNDLGYTPSQVYKVYKKYQSINLR